MPIIGFNIDKLSAEKKKPVVGDIRIRNDMSIIELTEEKRELKDDKEGILKFAFEFKTEYQQDIGEIIIQGHLLYLDEDKKIKEIIKKWKKERSIETDLLTRVLNVILVRCTIKALSLSQEMNLPPNTKIPTVSPKQNMSDYIG